MSIGAYFSRHAQVLIGCWPHRASTLCGLDEMGVIAVALALPLFLSCCCRTRAAPPGIGTKRTTCRSIWRRRPAPCACSRWPSSCANAPMSPRSASSPPSKRSRSFRSDSGFGTALNALADNPLPDTLVVTPTLTASTPRGTESLKNAIAAMSDVQTVQIDTEWVKRLHAMLDLLRRVVLLTGGLLGIGIVLIVSNTIRLDILNRRAEIEVMKLVVLPTALPAAPFSTPVSGTDWAAGLLALLLVAVASTVLARPVAQLVFLYGSAFSLQGLKIITGLAVLGLSVALSWIGSWLAATRHIRAIEPA